MHTSLDFGAAEAQQPVLFRHQLLVYLLQICLHSCFQKAMVDSCGCAQYAQPLPAGAEYCNYKKNPNWSKYSKPSLTARASTTCCQRQPSTAPSPVSTALPTPSTFPATQRAGNRQICFSPLKTQYHGA